MDAKDFRELFDLSHPALQGLITVDDDDGLNAIAGATVQGILNAPVTGLFSHDEALEVGRLLVEDCPGIVEKTLRYLEIARSQPSLADMCKNQRQLIEYHDYACDARNFTLRARGLLVYGQLLIMTGEKKYADEARDLLFKLQDMSELELPEDEEIPLQILPWHPNHTGHVSALAISHNVEALGIVLPIFWKCWDADTRRFAIEYMADISEKLYRGYRDAPPYNIPLHGLTGMLATATLFPQLKNAPKWKELMQRYLSEGGRYVSAPYVTGDGYYGEGLSYQWVNQWLITNCYLYLEQDAGAPDALKRLVIAGFDFSAATVRPDGMYFLVGDMGGRASHEHEIEHHEVLNLAAGLFDRPDYKQSAGAMRGNDIEPTLALMMGPARYRRWREMPATPLEERQHRVTPLPESGFLYVGTEAGLDKASHGLLKASLEHNHGHNDCLSVCLFAEGRELISDSGSLGYAEPGFSMQKDINAHSTARVGHLSPAGPRHETRTAITLSTVFENSEDGVTTAIGEHHLYEKMVFRRALMKFDAPDIPGGIWFVWDRIASMETEGGQEREKGDGGKLLRVAETRFNLHCSGSSTGREALTGWSRHTPDDILEPFHKNGVTGITSADANTAVEQSDSDGNIQITALSPVDINADIGLEISDGFISHYGFACKRQVLDYKWRGVLPHEAVYALLPFRGVVDKPAFAVNGWCGDLSRPGCFEAEIGGPEGNTLLTISASGLNTATQSKAPEFRR